MATVTTVSPLAIAPAPPVRRPRVLLVGSALAAGASALLVMTSLAAYLQIRGDLLADGATALPEEVILPLTPGNMGLLTLAMSVITMAWAAYALRNDDRPHAYLALGITLVLGVAFLNSTAYLYQQLLMGFDASATSALLYITTGAHLLMVVVGMLYAAVMAFHALGGQLTGRDAEGMSAAALYWYVTVAVYVPIWYGIYISK